MLETGGVLCPSQNAMRIDQRQRDYDACWSGLEKTFVRPNP
jgi:homogentisate 1,2-dioxygenase